MQVGRSADAQQLAAAFQLGGHGDGIGWLAAPVEIEDAVEDDLMSGPVEVLTPQDFHDTGDGVFGQQHSAEYGLLSRDVLRRLPIEGLHARLLAAVEPDTAVVNQRHPWVPLRRLPTSFERLFYPMTLTVSVRIACVTVPPGVGRG